MKNKQLVNPRCPGCGALMAPAIMFVPEEHLPIRTTGCLNKTYESLAERNDDLEKQMNDGHPARVALRLVLDSIDYERGACSLTEMVGACLPVDILRKAREAAGLK